MQAMLQMQFADDAACKWQGQGRTKAGSGLIFQMQQNKLMSHRNRTKASGCESLAHLAASGEVLKSQLGKFKGFFGLGAFMSINFTFLFIMWV